MTNMENEGKITNHWLVGLAEVLLVFAGDVFASILEAFATRSAVAI